jgi:hypothetical protein
VQDAIDQRAGRLTSYLHLHAFNVLQYENVLPVLIRTRSVLQARRLTKLIYLAKLRHNDTFD